MQKVALGVIVLLAIASIGSYGFYQQNQAAIRAENANQLLTYQNAILKDQVAHANYTEAASSNQSIGSSVQAFASYYIGTPDKSANQTLVNRGFIPNCLTECSGITYYKDPTTLITNEGHDFIQIKLSGFGHSVGPATTDFATIEGLSASTNGATVTDTFVGTAGPCTSTTAIVAGPLYATLSPSAGTVVTGTPSAGSVTWTVSFTWTYNPTVGPNTVNAGCLWTHVPGTAGPSPYIFAEISGVGPFTLAMGDTLMEVWSVTAT